METGGRGERKTRGMDEEEWVGVVRVEGEGMEEGVTNEG